MSKTNKQKRKKSIAFKIVISLMIIVASCILIYAGFRLYRILSSYKQASGIYTEIENIFEKKDPTQPDNPFPNSEITDTDYAPFDYDVPFEYDYDALRAQYPDAIGWIYLKDRFSYPIFQETAENEYYYLNHLPDGTWNTSGSLFVDKMFNNGLNGTYSIIYGHNMNNGSMFGTLHSYHSYDKYINQTKMHVFIGYEHYVYKVIGTLQAATDGFIYNRNNLDDRKEYNEFIEKVKENSEYEIDTDALTNTKNQIITLSTCTTSLSDYYRYAVVIARDHLVAK